MEATGLLEERAQLAVLDLGEAVRGQLVLEAPRFPFATADGRRAAWQVELAAAALEGQERQYRVRPRRGQERLPERQARVERSTCGPLPYALAHTAPELVEPLLGEVPVARGAHPGQTLRELAGRQQRTALQR